MKLALIILSTAFLVSCIKKEEEPGIFDDSFLIFTQKVTETFAGNILTAKEIIEYEYDRINDFFWKKAVFKDSLGNIIKVIEREFDPKNWMPIKDSTIISDEVIEINTLKYSLNNHELLLSEKFIGEVKPENKTMTTEWEYNKQGYLISETVTIYHINKNFMNVDSNRITDTYKLRILPAVTSRPKGMYKPYYFVEFRKRYDETGNSHSKSGNLLLEIKTEFDEHGYPSSYYKSELIDSSMQVEKEWYKAELDDDGRLLSLSGKANKSLDSTTATNSQILFEYNSDGLLAKIEEYQYLPEEDDYLIFTDMKIFTWNIPDIHGRYNFTDYSLYHEHYDLHQKRHSIIESRIVQFDKVGKKIIEEYQDGYNGEYNTHEIKPELTKRTTYYYHRFEKQGEGGVIMKNKKNMEK